MNETEVSLAQLKTWLCKVGETWKLASGWQPSWFLVFPGVLHVDMLFACGWRARMGTASYCHAVGGELRLEGILSLIDQFTFVITDFKSLSPVIFKGYENEPVTSLFIWWILSLIHFEYFCIMSIKFTIWQVLVFVYINTFHSGTRTKQNNPEEVSLNKFIC